MSPGHEELDPLRRQQILVAQQTLGSVSAFTVGVLPALIRLLGGLGQRIPRRI